MSERTRVVLFWVALAYGIAATVAVVARLASGTIDAWTVILTCNVAVAVWFVWTFRRPRVPA